jgi:hypothetical protein
MIWFGVRDRMAAGLIDGNPPTICMKSLCSYLHCSISKVMRIKSCRVVTFVFFLDCHILFGKKWYTGMVHATKKLVCDSEAQDYDKILDNYYV